MKTTPSYQLTQAEIDDATAVGYERVNNAAGHGWQERYAAGMGDVRTNILGANGELALARYLGLEWTGRKHWAVDVGGCIEVKATTYMHGCLIVQGDKPGSNPVLHLPHVLAIGYGNGLFLFPGWYGVPEAWAPQFKKEGQNSWWIPQERLHDMKDLPTLATNQTCGNKGVAAA